MRRYINILMVVVVLASCTDNPHLLKRDYGTWSVSMPREWEDLPIEGSFHMLSTAIDERDTVYMDASDDANDFAGEGFHVVDPIADRAMNALSKISIDTIDGKVVEIIVPITSGRGRTGAYFVKADQFGAFSFYGDNLSPQNEKLFLRVLRTLAFPKP
jgi:hypothetical protein